ncbi:hypothetical protein CSUNSWCD_1389 [Campylobacter showae CSUNSWCD]|uniref:Uncharacterized protein n=1 Tax=Campylobacter showae CSUNSWCD TaxID=1244083 RepID=M5IH92_9BACT|nr:hypothetical protein CSUNSWCD_1389 [Campylobacter showae CSUNSWCD]
MEEIIHKIYETSVKFDKKRVQARCETDFEKRGSNFGAGKTL